MATTAGTTFGIAPAFTGGPRAPQHTVIPIDPSNVIQDGDVIVCDGTTGDAVANNAPTVNILGVARIKGSQTAAATINREAGTGPDVNGVEHVVNIALALPGTMFQANIMDASATDHTGVYQDDIRALVGHELGESTQGHACVENDANTNVVVYVLSYVTPQFDIVASPNLWRYGRLAGVGMTNPRANIFFLADATSFSADIGS